MDNISGKNNDVKKVLMFGLKNSGKTTILYKLKLGDVVNTSTNIDFNNEIIEYKEAKFSIYDIGWIFHVNNLYNPDNINSLEIGKLKLNDHFSSSSKPSKSYYGKESDLDNLKEKYEKYDTRTILENVSAIIIVIDCGDRFALTHSNKFAPIETSKVEPSLVQIFIVSGYLRSEEKKNNMNIPEGIIDVCVSFYAVEQSVKDLKDVLFEMEQLKDLPVLFYANKSDLLSADKVCAFYQQIMKKLGLDSTQTDWLEHWYLQCSCAITGDGLYEGLDWIYTRALAKK